MVKDIVKGSLQSMALGNAYGSRFEKADLPAGEERWFFSDDFPLALAVCTSVLEQGQPEPDSILSHLQQSYMESQLAGLGDDTLKTLATLVKGEHWSSAGSHREPSNGNGAALRFLPLAFLSDPFSDEGRNLVQDLCDRTNFDQEACDGALAACMAIRLVQNDRQNLIQGILKHLPEGTVRDRIADMSHETDGKIYKLGKQYGAGSSALETVPLAIYAAGQATQTGIANMMKDLVMAGGDSDAVCAIAGAIAGAYLGSEAISEEWMDKLRGCPGYEEHLQVIRNYADFVQEHSGIQTLF